MKVGDIMCGALRLPSDTPPMFVIHRGPVVEFDDAVVQIESASTGEPVAVPRMLVADSIDACLFDLYDYVKTMLVRVRSRASANPSKVFGWVAQQAAMEADLRSSVVIVDCGIVSGEPPNEEQPEYQQDSDGVYRPKPKDLSKPKSTAFAQQKRRRRRKKKRVLH